jgi:hypothetical protein
MLFAMVLMVSMPLVPHHHHHGEWCNIIEHCDIDCADNDVHTTHHGDATKCVEETEYLISKSDVKRSGAESYKLHFTSLLAALIPYLTEDSGQPSVSEYGEQPMLHYAHVYADSSGLRAPPMP